MTTRRITRPTDPKTGLPLSYEHRRAARIQSERLQRSTEREAKRVEAEAAALQPAAPKLTYAQRATARQQADLGRRIAQDKADELARAAAPERNPYRDRLAALQGNGPGVQHRRDRFTALADEWDRNRADEQAAAERKAELDSSPAVKLVREYAAGLVKLTSNTELAGEANECVGIAEQGDTVMAWERMKALDEKVFQRLDRIAAEKLASKTATDSDFQAAASEATAARERADQSAKMVPTE